MTLIPIAASIATRATSAPIMNVGRACTPKGGRPERTALDRSGTQPRLGDLAHRVARQRVQIAHLARALVRREQPGDVVGELALGRWCGPLHHHPRDDALAEILVGL